MPDLEISGGGVASIHSTALAATLGTQKTTWSNAIRAAYIGTNAKLILKRNGSTVYSTTFSGAASTNADGNIVLPTSLGSVVSNVAADIDSGTWTARIELASDSSKGITGTLGPPGAGKDFSLSADTDGTTPATVGSIILQAPSTLDVGYVPPGVGSIPVYGAQTTVDDMGLANDFNADQHSAPWATGRLPDGTIVKPAAVVMGTRGEPSEMEAWWKNDSRTIPYQGYSWRYFTNWMVIFWGAGHSGSNLAARITRAKMLGRRRSDGQWVLLWKASSQLTTEAYDWFRASVGNVVGYPGALQSRTPESDVIEVFMGNPKTNVPPYSTHGTWGGLRSFDPTPYDCIWTGMVGSLVLWNPAGTDDRSGSQLVMHVGGDYYPTGGHTPDAAYPSCGISRLVRLSETPRWHTMATLLNARQAYTGPTSAVSVQSFLSNPPPRALVEAA